MSAAPARTDPSKDDAVVAVYARFRAVLVRRCAAIVGSTAVAEEIAQESFARALEHAPTSGPDRPLEAWLTTVATRLAIDHLRRGARDVASVPGIDAAEPAPPRGMDPTSRTVIDREMGERLHAALGGLDARARRALVLYGVEGWSYEEIARAERISLPALKMTIHRARARVRDALGAEGLLGTLPGVSLARRVLRRLQRTSAEVGEHAQRMATWTARFEALTAGAAGAAGPYIAGMAVAVASVAAAGLTPAGAEHEVVAMPIRAASSTRPAAARISPSRDAQASATPGASAQRADGESTDAQGGSDAGEATSQPTSAPAPPTGASDVAGTSVLAAQPDHATHIAVRDPEAAAQESVKHTAMASGPTNIAGEAAWVGPPTAPDAACSACSATGPTADTTAREGGADSAIVAQSVATDPVSVASSA
jgi:RNA polymerase sigma-70 factor (ECF subfamily)